MLQPNTAQAVADAVERYGPAPGGASLLTMETEAAQAASETGARLRLANPSGS